MLVGTQTRSWIVAIAFFIVILSANAKLSGRLSSLNKLRDSPNTGAVKRFFTTYIGLLERCDVKKAITNYAADARLYNRDGQIRTRDDVETALTAFCKRFGNPTISIDTIEQVDPRTFFFIVRIEVPGVLPNPILVSDAIRFRFTYYRGQLRAQPLRVVTTFPTSM